MENDITISDLEALREIVSLACQRGAIQPGEMLEVGTLYNKLSHFLASAKLSADTQAAHEQNIGEPQ